MTAPTTVVDETIVCFASNYFFTPTSKHHVMRELSRTRSVLWVNWHASRRPSLNGRDAGAILQKLRQVREGVQRVGERMWVLTPLVIPLPSSPTAKRLNRRLVTWQIGRALKRLPRRRQLWSFAPDVGSLLGSFGEKERIYYCVDEFSAFPGYEPDVIRRLDREMCERCDLVLTSSRGLYEAKRPFNENTVHLPHGVNYRRFAAALRPDFPVAEDLKSLPRPRIGYYGLVHEWQDLDLVERLADARPEWSFVLVGPVRTDVSALAARPNVHLLGERPHEELPRYSRGFDAAIIPHRASELTRNMNPIKLREYLAAGLPVVASRLPEARSYEPHVRTATTDAEWLDALERAIASRSPEADAARSAAVADEDWSVRVERILGELERVRERRVDGPAVGTTSPSAVGSAA